MISSRKLVEEAMRSLDDAEGMVVLLADNYPVNIDGFGEGLIKLKDIVLKAGQQARKRSYLDNCS